MCGPVWCAQNMTSKSSLAERLVTAPRLVVVGGGPAGLSAAVEGRRAGFQVTLIDEDARLGGQFYGGRSEDHGPGSPAWFRQRDAGIQTQTETSVVDSSGHALVTWNVTSGCREVLFDSLILASGAYDRAVALPGWTLPGVMTAGGALTFSKAHHVLIGRRVVVSGSGPFLLPVGLALARIGARVRILEATPFRESLGGLGQLVRDPETLRQAFTYRAELAARGARHLYGRMITAITGEDHATEVVHHAVDEDWNPVPGSERTEGVDAAAIGFGFTPRVDLAQLLGCQLDYDRTACTYQVHIDSAQRTSRAGIYAAGEATGVAGAQVAKLGGRLAALAAAADMNLVTPDEYKRLRSGTAGALAAARRTQRWLGRAFRPREGLWRLAGANEIVCRCEEVTLGQLEASLQANSGAPRAVKSVTRAGMGLCQGAICAPLITELLRSRFGYQPPDTGRDWSVRPPLRPIPVGDWPMAASGAE